MNKAVNLWEQNSWSGKQEIWENVVKIVEDKLGAGQTYERTIYLKDEIRKSTRETRHYRKYLKEHKRSNDNDKKNQRTK